MIKTVAHVADIHIRKSPTRNNEYEQVFENLYKSLEEKKPDRIVVVGDLVHDYLDLQGEQLILGSSFLNRLAAIAPVRITRGNHDMRKKSIKRTDSVEAIVKSINNSNIIYYNEIGFFNDENVTWAVWKHGIKDNNPWNIKKKTIPDGNITIDLFHDPVQGSTNNFGFEFNKKTLTEPKQFKGKYAMLGDIHKLQYLNKAKTIAYPSSLIAQDFGEGDDAFHGYLLWDITTGAVEEVSIENNYSFKNITINPFTELVDIDLEVDNPTPHMKIRVNWRTLPATRSKENERNVVSYLKNKYESAVISSKNEFLEEDKIDIEENVTIENIVDQATQHEIFKNYLEKIGVDQETIDEIIKIDDEITSRIDLEELTNIEWDIIRFDGENFMSYKDIEIDWRDMDGLFQIYGLNTAGKTTIIKLITYILYNKTLETENRVLYGDKRYLCDKLPVKHCEGNIVIKANDQYYGIKRRTEITKNKAGEITGAPTTLRYYLLETPDDEFSDDNSLETLSEDVRKKTQKVIERVIGSYNNFMRVVFTTSDTLNDILSNDMSEFVDSLLYDSGLDVFDLKLKELKIYQAEENNNKVRVSCNVDGTKNQIGLIEATNVTLEGEIKIIETDKLPEIQGKIKTGSEYIENFTKKLHKIDSEIYNLNVDDCNVEILNHKTNIATFETDKKLLEDSIIELKETYDEERLNAYLKDKDDFKQTINDKKLMIKTFEQKIRDEEHTIEIINGEIFRLKNDGVKLKTAIIELRESKICPTCGQALTEEHQHNIDDNIENKETEMYSIANTINSKETVDKPKHVTLIEEYKKEIENINAEIVRVSLNMEKILNEIGILTNEKNDVEKRKEIISKIEKIPFQIENETLKIDVLKRKIDQYNQSLIQIEENKTFEKTILLAKEKLKTIKDIEYQLNNDMTFKSMQIQQNKTNIDKLHELIVTFEAQEKRDNHLNLYKKCVHRDGIPKQMLVNYIIPKINAKLKDSLANVPFIVWLDLETLRLKFAYNNNMDAVIDAISSSGKERTFASLSLKSALNEINAKSKPSMFLMDELTGKLDDFSVEEFIEFIHLIKSRMKKVMIVEYKHEIDPDYIITVTKDEEGISHLEIE